MPIFTRHLRIPLVRNLAAIAGLLIFCAAANAATLTVTKTADTNDGTCNFDCSLREAIALAAPGDTIVFNAVFDTPRTISLTMGELLINKTLTIVGKGARLTTVQRSTAAGTPNFRIFHTFGGTIIISGITIANGHAGTEAGGGIYHHDGTLSLEAVWIRNNVASLGAGITTDTNGTLNINNSTISNNLPPAGNIDSTVGGGISSTWNTRISNSTISDNIAGQGGGIRTNQGLLELNNVTVTNNQATVLAGGITAASGSFRNTIIAQNTSASGSAPDVAGTYTSRGNNLIGTNSGNVGFINGVNGDKVGTNTALLNPQLSALQNNGGETDTRMPLSNSPALDAGNNCVTDLSCPNNNPPSGLFLDQRGAGFLRQFAGAVDMGAVEAGTAAVVNPNDSGPGSLRQVIVDIRANGIILLRIPTYAAGCVSNAVCTITLTSGELAVNKSLDIRGRTSGARYTIIQRSPAAGTPNFRLFNITGTGTIFRLRDLTVTNGNPSANGGAIHIGAGSTLSLDEVAVTNNIGSAGGAIMNFGDLFIEGSTLSGNHGTNDSGAIRNNGNAVIYNSTLSGNRSSNNGGAILDGGTLTLINTTITGNSGNVGGGIIKNSGGALSLRNTIIAGNISGNGGTRTDVFGSFTSHGNNLIGNNEGSAASFPAGMPNANGDIVGTFAAPVNPNLTALANNGGGTDTHMVLPNSPALNAGNNCVVNATCPTINSIGPLANDQRNVGTARQVGPAVDIGAFELRIENIANTNDSGAGSLRQTMTTTPPGSIITFNYSDSTPGCSGGVCVINLTSGSLFFNKSVTIVGPGARRLVIQRSTASGTPGFRVLNIDGYPFGATVGLSGLTIANGRGGIYAQYCQLDLDGVAIRDNSVSDAGGGILILSSVATILNSAIYNNAAIFSNSNPPETVLGFGHAGGGIYSSGSVLSIANTTITGNVAGDSGGGISNGASAALTLNNVTVSHNQVSGVGGGIYAFSPAIVRNAVIAKNVDLNTFELSPDVAGSVSTLGDNLIGDNSGSAAAFPAGNPNANGDIVGTGAAPVDPLLGPFQNNGGETDTRALMLNSPARNAGNNCVTNLSCSANNPPVALGNDQRGVGFPRLVGGTVDIGSFEVQDNRRSPFDFDGDGKTDIGIFRPTVAEWWIQRSSTGVTFAAQFGSSTDVIAPGDFTGDGKADIAFFRPSNGNWFILRSEDFSFYSFPFGANGDIPAPADYDNDGKTDPAVFRPSAATWYIMRSAGGVHTEQFGANGDRPVAGDYDGDGRADIAIFRPSNGQWWLNRSTAGVIALSFGGSSDKPVTGDFTGDGKADAAFWRPSTGEWFVLRSENFSFYSFPFGTSGDVPAPGDYDGDGTTDASVFRPSSLLWFVQRSGGGVTTQQFGAAGDRPIPNAYVP